MNATSMIPFSGEINFIREKYDTDNPIIANVLKAKEERLKILQELNKQYQEEFDINELLLKNDLKKNKNGTAARKSRKSEFINNSPTAIRRSLRIKNIPIWREKPLFKSPAKNQFVRPSNDYGAVPGVEVGTHWETRMECSSYGVHRPTVAGIHGGPDGAYSIALSGGYPEDVDEGNFFIYTGAGGRDLKGTSMKPKNLRVAPQTKNQKLEGTNLSLVKSIESKLPVRVIRGYKSPSVFAPETGYRYDGLYQVVKYWEDIGTTGYRIYRFRMERMKDQPPAPWETKNEILSGTKASRTKNEVLENNFADENQGDFKENVAPDAIITSPDANTTFREGKDVDYEIQKCIEFFCKAAVIKCKEDIEIGCNESEFCGWDL